MKVLLTGANGQLGRELRSTLATLGDVLAFGHGSSTGCLDLGDPTIVGALVAEANPDVIVNAAAYTQVDRAEDEPEIAHRVNAEGPAILAKAATACGALMVHYSTDYVFNGQHSVPWTESDQPDPLNVYGISKLAGERNVAESGARHLIFRTSWIYGRHGNNFLRTMLNLMPDKPELKVVDDQVGAPTSAELIAGATAHAIGQSMGTEGRSGVYHLTAHGEVSWYGFAKYVRATASEINANWSGAACRLLPTSSEQFGARAVRPKSSRLDCSKFEAEFNLRMPEWQPDAQKIIQEFV